MIFFWAVASMMLSVPGSRPDAVWASPAATAARRRLMAVRRRERWARLRSRAAALWRMRFSADFVLAMYGCSSASERNRTAVRQNGVLYHLDRGAVKRAKLLELLAVAQLSHYLALSSPLGRGRGR